MTSGSSGYLTIHALVEAAAKLTGTPVEAILGPRRPQALVRIRACVARIADQERLKCGRFSDTRWSLPRIGKALGYSDHTSVCNLLKNWEDYCKDDPNLPYLVERIREEALHPSPVEPKAESTPAPAPGKLGSNQHLGTRLVTDAPPSTYRKGKNDFRADDPEEADGAHAFHAKMAKASVKFAEALLGAKKS